MAAVSFSVQGCLTAASCGVMIIAIVIIMLISGVNSSTWHDYSLLNAKIKHCLQF